MWIVKVRIKAQEGRFRPVTWGGLYYYADKEQLENLIIEMEKAFPQNEYILEEYNEPSDTDLH